MSIFGMHLKRTRQFSGGTAVFSTLGFIANQLKLDINQVVQSGKIFTLNFLKNRTWTSVYGLPRSHVPHANHMALVVAVLYHAFVVGDQ